MTTLQGMLLVMTDIDPTIEHDFNQWYEQEHLAERMAIPGFLRARRFTAIEGSPKYLALYDLESPRFSIPRTISMWSERESRPGPGAWSHSLEISRAMSMYRSPTVIDERRSRVFTAAGSNFQLSAALRDRDARAPRRRVDSAA